MNKHKRFLLIAFLSISALLIILFGIFTRPKYIPYEDGLIGTVNRNEAGIVDISFCTSATNYQLKANSQGEYTISLYTTAWDDIVKNKKEITNITFDTTKNEVKSIYYVSCGMADDVLMYGQSAYAAPTVQPDRRRWCIVTAGMVHGDRRCGAPGRHAENYSGMPLRLRMDSPSIWMV